MRKGSIPNAGIIMVVVHLLIALPIVAQSQPSTSVYPDLIVKDIKIVHGCQIEVVLANIGSAGVPDTFYELPKAVGVQMYRGLIPWGGIILKGFDPTGKLKLPGGVASYIWFPTADNLKLEPGIHTITVVVDSNKVLTESNEKNNTLTRRLRCVTPVPE